MKKTLTLFLAMALSAAAAAQPQQTVEVKNPDRLKVSGYIQGQYQWGEQDAFLKVGSDNESDEKPFNRFGIRRGRVKFTYQTGIALAVVQLDINEKNGVGFKDAYLNIKDPWFGSMALRAGVFDRPFGYEISYSSSRRQSPEHSTVFQKLFPEERDLGAMLLLRAPESTPWSILQLEAGLFAGNGIKPETDSKRDFIGHLSAAKEWHNFSFGAGVSYYNGKVWQGTENVYTMVGSSFTHNNSLDNKGKFAMREYIGLDARISFGTPIGNTRISAEYLFGQQPGTAENNGSPNYSSLPSLDTYIRDFQGGYVMLVHEIAQTPVGIVAKYDWYDPNTRVSGNGVGAGGTTLADLSQSTIGIGALWDIIPALRLTVYYEFNRNETTSALAGLGEDLKDDAFTLRLQYKF